MTASDDNGPGRIDHPEIPGDDGPRTCLGGLLPEAGSGPDAAGAPAFVDPTPDQNGSGDEVVLIPDGASPSSDVVRAQWNPDSGLFEFLDTVPMIQSVRTSASRPVATSLGADGNVYVVFQRESTVQRITGPAGAQPPVDVVGQTATVNAPGRSPPARMDPDAPPLYIAEDAGLGRLRPGNATTLASPAFRVHGVTTRHRRACLPPQPATCWSARPRGCQPGQDVVQRIKVSDGDIEAEYGRGYSMIGGLAVRPDGFVLVLDDPALLDAAEPMGMGRMFHIGLPAAHIAGDPSSMTCRWTTPGSWPTARPPSR